MNDQSLKCLRSITVAFAAAGTGDENEETKERSIAEVLQIYCIVLKNLDCKR